MTAGLLIGATRFLVGGHAQWRGCAPEARQRIYFANHSSHLDTLLLWAALPAALRRTTRPVAALDYWGAGPIRRHIATRMLNAVLIDRHDRKDPLAPMRGPLERGASLILFPEGTRQASPLPGPFRPGLYHLARAFPAVELVPVYLANPARAYPKGAILPAPIICSVMFGASIMLGSTEPKAAFLARARDAICNLATETAL